MKSRDGNVRSVRALALSVYINMDEPKISRSDFDKHMEWVKSVLATWPEWKRNVLSRCLEPMNKRARDFVDNFQHDDI